MMISLFQDHGYLSAKLYFLSPFHKSSRRSKRVLIQLVSMFSELLRPAGTGYTLKPGSLLGIPSVQRNRKPSGSALNPLLNPSQLACSVEQTKIFHLVSRLRPTRLGVLVKPQTPFLHQLRKAMPSCASNLVLQPTFHSSFLPRSNLIASILRSALL